MATLQSGALKLVLEPVLGGSVKSFTHNGQDIFRPTKAGASVAGDTAAFPMFPFSGRIANGQFLHGDRPVALTSNKLPEPHAIHGDAWQAEWVIDQISQDSAAMMHIHTGNQNIWPWAYAAKQVFTLSDDTLTVELSMTNLSDAPMPAGLGWHPYFSREDATLMASVRSFWPVDETMLPVGPVPLSSENDLTANPKVKSLRLDNPFTCAERRATIHWPARNRTVMMQWTTPLDFLVVYTPTAKDFFCVEPVSHIPNSVNSALSNHKTGHAVLASGDTLSAKITLQIT